tara:strand:+ start:482 stop:883 length:402 start_codon:yes stop_codon:yes gene_type:complete
MNFFNCIRRLRNIRRWWWQAAAPGLMEENRYWKDNWDRIWDEREKLEDQIDELEASLHKKENFYRYISPGYWHVTENSLFRLDNKFIEYYRTHQEPIQEELEFTYVRPPTKEEDTRQEEKQIREEHEHYNTGK